MKVPFWMVEDFELKYSDKDFDKQKKNKHGNSENFKVNLSEGEWGMWEWIHWFCKISKSELKENILQDKDGSILGPDRIM